MRPFLLALITISLAAAGDTAVWIDGITLLQDRVDTLQAGDAFAEVTGVLAVQWVQHPQLPAPAFVAADHPWLAATADPSALLGLEPREPLHRAGPARPHTPPGPARTA